jgi:putative ATPase
MESGRGSEPAAAVAVERTFRAREAGHGAGYKYPRDFAVHHVAADRLPDALRGAKIYEPSAEGRELGARLRGLREAARLKPRDE